MNLTYKYRLLTKEKDYKKLNILIEDQRHLYNDALEERIECYKKMGKGLTFYDQCGHLTEARREIDGLSEVPVNLQRGTLKRLDEAFKSFFRRCKKKGEKAGFPRFRGSGWFKTLEWDCFTGVSFNGKSLKSKAFGQIRVHLHRPLPENPDIRSVKLVRDSKGWSVCFSVKVNSKEEKSNVENPIGIDLGLTNFLTLSNGEKIPSLKSARKSEKKLRVAQRRLSRCKKGSNRRKKAIRKVAKVHEKIKNQRQTYAHQISARLVKEFDQIVVEDLNIKGMVKSKLAKSINDSGWGNLLDKLEYKAEKAGIWFERVDPKYTSQDCSSCGARKKKELYERWHSCECGLELDRDHNAALNILAKSNRGVVIPEAHKVGSRLMLVPGKISYSYNWYTTKPNMECG